MNGRKLLLPLRRRWCWGGISTVFDTMQKRSSWAIQKAVVFALVLRELRTRISMRNMGAFWLVFEPIGLVLVVVFERVFLRGINIQVGEMTYAMFIITGIVPHYMFKNIVLLGMGAIDANRNLFAYRQVKPLDCIVARTIMECMLRVLGYTMLMFLMGFWLGYDISIARPLEWLSILFLGVLFSLSLSIIFCIWAEAMPNIKTIIRLAFMPVSFLSDFIIPISKFPVQMQRWLSWNPFLQLNVKLRTAISPDYPALPGVDFKFVILITIILLPISLMLYHSRRNKLVAI